MHLPRPHISYHTQVCLPSRPILSAIFFSLLSPESQIPDPKSQTPLISALYCSSSYPNKCALLAPQTSVKYSISLSLSLSLYSNSIHLVFCSHPSSHPLSPSHLHLRSRSHSRRLSRSRSRSRSRPSISTPTRHPRFAIHLLSSPLLSLKHASHSRIPPHARSLRPLHLSLASTASSQRWTWSRTCVPTHSLTHSLYDDGRRDSGFVSASHFTLQTSNYLFPLWTV
ncbi:hypothetical protein CC80DRAFT_120422 [Byssothecium circinans]|uniref:Uncharacterized protein n=1 Tax=Byssothecium circinans TaxID=147558 RepID=A0A6A5TPA3_9PLEO|nr:hypothetical protein CC80DRAFT_120422 [Byssothecium circinans]